MTKATLTKRYCLLMANGVTSRPASFHLTSLAKYRTCMIQSMPPMLAYGISINGR